MGNSRKSRAHLSKQVLLRPEAGYDIFQNNIELVGPTPDTKVPGAVSFSRRVTAPDIRPVIYLAPSVDMPTCFHLHAYRISKSPSKIRVTSSAMAAPVCETRIGHASNCIIVISPSTTDRARTSSMIFPLWLLYKTLLKRLNTCGSSRCQNYVAF